jgi:hypothetical protein
MSKPVSESTANLLRAATKEVVNNHTDKRCFIACRKLHNLRIHISAQVGKLWFPLYIEIAR